MSDSSHPLKIIHVANLALKPKPPGFFGTPYKISNGLTRAGHFVANFSDRDAARASSILRNRKSGASGANAKLCELAAEFHPNLILFGHADTIRPATLSSLRKIVPHVRLAQWNVDPIFEEDNITRINRKIDLVDVTFVSTAGERLRHLSKDGQYRVAFLPNPVDPSIERWRAFDLPREMLRHDLLFAAGSGRFPRHHGGVDSNAEAIVDRICQALPNLRGDFPGIRGSSPVSGLAYEKAVKSAAMALNISRRNDVYLYSSDRIAQMVGSGLLTFIDRATGYNQIFDEDELAFYSTEAELTSRLEYFIRNDAERRRVAEAGWGAYRALFDVERVAHYIVGVAMEDIDPGSYEWKR